MSWQTLSSELSCLLFKLWSRYLRIHPRNALVMGSDNVSIQPKRTKWRSYLSSSLLLVGSFLLPFICLAILVRTRRLPDARLGKFSRAPRIQKRSFRAPYGKVTKDTNEKLPPANLQTVAREVPLPMDDSLPKPCANCPQIESISPSRGPVTGDTVITVTGHRLGTTRSLRSVTVGSVPCISFQSIDTSQLKCRIPAGTGANLPVIVTVETSAGTQRGTGADAKARWSYLPPKIHSVYPNHATRRGGTVITLSGEGFGRSESYPIATIGGVSCQSTKWISDSVIKCVVPAGAGSKLPVHVTVCGCGDASRSPQSSLSSAAQTATFSYDEDVMRAAARSIIHGMDLRPHRGFPVITNLRQLDSQYEIRFTNPITGRTVYYAVPPELASVLPKSDLSKRYDTCAVVGPAGSLLGSGHGERIDAANAVFRINNSPTHRFEADAGTKTTFQIVNQFWAEMLMNSGDGPQDVKWWFEDATLVLTSPYSQESFILLRQLFPMSSVVFMSRALSAAGWSATERMRSRIQETMGTSFGSITELSSTFYATLMAMQICSEVHLYGIDTRSSKSHYYDDYDQGDEERSHEGLEYLMYLVMQANGYITAIHEGAETAQVAQEVQEKQQQQPQCMVRPCILSCNSRGVSVNGTCHCEPIYSGSDCSINLLADTVDDLLEGIDVFYKGPIEMCRASVNGTFIQLPEGITRQKLREGDIYQVDRALYHALPEEDPADRFGSCAVVGNSGLLLNKELGKEIDSHDLIYRFNQAPTRGYETHVGGRTTHESLNGFWIKELLDERRGFRWNWRSRDTAIVLFEMFEPSSFGWKTKTQILEKDHWWRQAYVRLRKMYPDRRIVSLNPHFVSWSYLLYRELRRRMQRAPIPSF
mmetsp:Transcript_30490/g.72600  ORF Transcript_30490/g.72600 Transcript_30490/m.72600 type:complete len:874 (-) Transcript_30490:139-2760(-)